jgi:hypothetical protein
MYVLKLILLYFKGERVGEERVSLQYCIGAANSQQWFSAAPCLRSRVPGLQPKRAPRAHVYIASMEGPHYCRQRWKPLRGCGCDAPRPMKSLSKVR